MWSVYTHSKNLRDFWSYIFEFGWAWTKQRSRFSGCHFITVGKIHTLWLPNKEQAKLALGNLNGIFSQSCCGKCTEQWYLIYSISCKLTVLEFPFLKAPIWYVGSFFSPVHLYVCGFPFNPPPFFNLNKTLGGKKSNRRSQDVKMPFWELASSLNSERSQVIFQVGYYCSCGSRIMKLNRIIGLNIWLEGWYRKKSMKGSTKTTERWVFLQSAQKKSIGEVCKLKRGRGTIGKKSKQRRGRGRKCPLNLKV